MSIIRTWLGHGRAHRHARAAGHRIHFTQLEERLTPANFDIPNGDVAAFVAAINVCNTNNQPDTINLAVNGTYTFTARADDDSGGSALPIIRLDGGNRANAITIQGHGATVQRASAAAGTPTFRFLAIGPTFLDLGFRAVDVAVSDLSVSAFDATQGTPTGEVPGGAAFLVRWANLTLTNCTIVANTSQLHGSVYVYGPRNALISIDRCTLLNNDSGISVEGESLSVSNSLIASSTIGPGINYPATGTCNVSDSTIRGNAARGLDSFGAVVFLRRSTVSGNLGGGLGASANSDLTITDTTFSNNVGAYLGGGVFTKSGRVTIGNSTFVGNRAVRGGAIAIGQDLTSGTPVTDAVISNCTIANNVAQASVEFFHGEARGGGVFLEPGARLVRFSNSVISGNALDTSPAPNLPSGGPDVSAVAAMAAFNLMSNGSGLTISGPNQGNLIGTSANPLDPQLGPLQDNGGPTFTRLPLDGSPLINAGDPAFVPPPQFDQRGLAFPRVRASRLDIGAVEVPAHDLGLTITDGRLLVLLGGSAIYTMVVRNNGDFTESAASVTLPLPAGATAMSWTSVAAGGASGSAGSGSGAISESLTLPPNSTVTYTISLTIAATASGTFVVNAHVAPPSGVSDLFAPNDSAQDVDSVLVGGRLLSAAPGAGRAPDIKLYAAKNAGSLYTISAYDPAFTGGVRIAVADFNADGIPDIVTGPGTGGGPHIKVFDAATGNLLRQFMAYDPAFRGGVFVAAGDVTGDGVPDIATGAGTGGAPHVRIFNGANGNLVREFMAFDPNFRGGVTVALGDVDGDHKADIITGPGFGGGPHLMVFSGATGLLLREKLVYDSAFRGGIFVADGDVDHDGKADIFTAPGQGGGPVVRVFRGTDLSPLSAFNAYDPAFRGGARVAATDVNGDGFADIVTGAGPGGGPHVRVFDGVTGAGLQSFLAFDSGFIGGIFVATG